MTRAPSAMTSAPHKSLLSRVRGTLAGLAAALCFVVPGAHGQSGSSWSNQGLIYLLGPTLDGTSGVGPIDTEVDLSAGDVFDNLDSAFLGMYRGEGERWGVMIDVVYMDLKADGTGDGGILRGSGSRASNAIASATYRLSPTTQLMRGAL